MTRRLVSATLPNFPWDTIAQARRMAESHPDGLVDLSVGTPVDPTPQFVQHALAEASDAHGYPTVWGTAQLRDAIVGYLERRWSVRGLHHENVLPVIGTKELVAWLPTQLGLSSDSTVIVPITAYPTYRVGAQLARARIVAADHPDQLADSPDPDGSVDLIWINSPANPSGRVMSADELRSWVRYARRTGAVLVSDECYGEFVWDGKAYSILDDEICGGDHSGLLAAYSLSKRSNMAGYRAGFLAGDETLVSELLTVRKHSGLMVSTPVSAAMVAALDDDGHVEVQADRYRRRRGIMMSALQDAGYRIDDSQGSLYLWATCGEDCRATVDRFARLGVLVAPGDFYVAGTSQHVRVGLTASDERIAAAAQRLRAGHGAA
ncbi:MAG: succinyldiaminopimelate transaminase [Cutibacterium granulosum]|uniref:succinyldiaminopimelate transaminase n=1 Tax=Cutibacterium granulosum TaxID=33011 RepID=UPI002B22317F|nr:succinyldiaminopimelate transaminase [Cutibacterium granulosum]MEA5644433.1 succinyldiaminopimelate transaminase [Cutibacterium granulosum]